MPKSPEPTTVGTHLHPRPITDEEFLSVRRLIHGVAGISLTEAKRQLVSSRLARRLRHYGYRTYREYYEHVTQRDVGGEELQRMVNCITTNKTDFFREPHHFDFLRQRVFAEAKAAPLRLWSAGCSSGEEPYTLAMTAHDHFGDAAYPRVEILASDVDTDVLKRAERAVYEADRVADVPEDLQRRYFLRGHGGATGTYRVKPAVREMVRFRQVNLIEPEWPIPRGLDAIFCRNVIIYFDRATQFRLMDRLARHLRPGGYLFLGHSETLHWLTDTFESVGGTVYRLRRGATTGSQDAPPPLLPAESRPEEGRRMVTIQAGGYLAGRPPLVVRTVLGSCVAACLYDPGTGVGGMNHFMLPTGDGASNEPARYGVHAMEILIDEILRLGGSRARLRAKVFGAARMLRATAAAVDVSTQNADFVHRYLADAGIPLDAERLGGNRPVEVRFHVGTGRAQVRELGAAQAGPTAVAEERYRRDCIRCMRSRARRSAGGNR